MDLRLALMAGIDIPIPECQIVIHQPRIKEIALIGETEFFTAIQTLSVNKNMIPEGKTLLSNTNNFQIFMTIMSEKETADKKEMIQQLFQIIFPQYQVALLPRSIMFTQGEQRLMVDESNFEALQEVIKEIFCLNSNQTAQQTFNPANKKAKEIADKIMRGRQRVAAQKGESGSIFTQYVSTLTIGIPMPLDECLNLTMYQLFDLIERYSLYVNWDIDIRSRLAGADIKDQPDNWRKNIH